MSAAPSSLRVPLRQLARGVVTLLCFAILGPGLVLGLLAVPSETSRAATTATAASAAALPAAFGPATPDIRVVDAGNDTLILLSPSNPQARAVVVDSRKLMEVLKARVVEARGLSEVAELAPATPRGGLGSDAKANAATAYVFGHTFASPFDSLRTTLRLRPLADPDDGALVSKLATIIPLSVLLGLIGLYRMAATQVRFAERRTNFVSAVSHELKTPLTAIRMHAEMLEEDLVDGAQKRHEYYKTITRESERLSRLIDNVLAFAELERKTRKLDTHVGDVLPVVKECIEVLRPNVQALGFGLELEVPDPTTPLPAVRFEPDALKQVIYNLVDNSLKYGRGSRERRILVRVERTTLGHAAAGVVLSVRDFGPGVRREHLKSIFEPFFRGEHELTRKNQGSGIGLSLVKGLAVAMGASVRGENALPGPGFVVRLQLSAN